MGGGWRALARILALEAVAATPTLLVLFLTPHVMEVMAIAAACLALGYFLLRMEGSRPLHEGAWLGVAIGGGVGLAEAEAAVVAAAQELAWVRPWLLSIVACAGIGIALGFLARYDKLHRSVRAARPRASPAGPHHFARLK